jgi:hypothetical protein
MRNPKFSIQNIIMVEMTVVICLALLSQQISTVSMAQPRPQIQTQTGSKVPPSIKMPVSEGYVDGKIHYFLATDSSDNKIANSITNSTGFKVNFAPSLAMVPISTREQGYDFLNGVKGNGSFGFQTPVASAVPGQKNYTPLVQLNLVRWNASAKPLILTSVSEIINAQKNGQLTIINTGIVINSPVVR